MCSTRRASPQAGLISYILKSSRASVFGTRCIRSPLLSELYTNACCNSSARNYSQRVFSTASMTHCASALEKDGSKDVGDAEWKKALTPRQFRVLREKATDRVGGPLDDFYGEGTYACAACGSQLYTSGMKFACGCGWPGFWDCMPKAVREEPDADGERVEIVCNACNGHLGHIFRGEGFRNPPPNERHCVNSTSLRFEPKL